MSGNEVRRYLTNDMDQGRVELLITMGGNGDWYIAIVPEGQHIARLAEPDDMPRLHACVRITTSGERREHHGAAAAVAALYRALGCEARLNAGADAWKDGDRAEAEAIWAGAALDLVQVGQRPSIEFHAAHTLTLPDGTVIAVPAGSVMVEADE